MKQTVGGANHFKLVSFSRLSRTPYFTLNRPATIRDRKDQTPKKLKWHGKLAAFSISVVGRALAFSMPVRLENEQEIFGPLKGSPVIFALWHNRLAAVPAIARHIPPNRGVAGMSALISASSDGALLARTLLYFKIQAVRGSSSRRGAQALLELTTWIKKGYDAAITPDGPRGPKYQVREGAIALSQLTGAPIVPLGITISPKHELKSWDAFQVPFPFSRCKVQVGRIIRPPANLSEQEREEWRQMLEAELRALNSH
ncbi:MAG: lysophospholipid acyltransferase family protein [Verrucomicrobiales bacterium]